MNWNRRLAAAGDASVPLLAAILECDLDILRQLEILVSHAAGIVRRARERHARVVDRNVRMMVGGLGDLGDFLHELDALQKFLELERLADGVVLLLPSGQRLQLLLDLLLTEFRHLGILLISTVASFLLPS